jgi:hypothetical protein
VAAVLVALLPASSVLRAVIAYAPPAGKFADANKSAQLVVPEVTGTKFGQLAVKLDPVPVQQLPPVCWMLAATEATPAVTSLARPPALPAQALSPS